MANRILCYDFGGTGLRVGVADREGMLNTTRKDVSHVNLNSELSGIAIHLGEIILNLTSTRREDLIGIGIGGAGTWQGLIITFAPNSPIRDNITFPCDVQANFKKPTIGGNDIRAAVHGAAMYGHGKRRDLEVVCAITYSTGNNIGILNKGLPYPGYSDLSQEVGHAHIEHDERNARWCGCGSQGCFEAYVSATAAANMAAERLRAVKHQLKQQPIYQVARQDLEHRTADLVTLSPGEIVWGIKAEHVYAALMAHPDDEIARWVCETQKYYIANQLAHVSLHHRPQLIELFGGLTNQADLLFNPAIQDLRKNPGKYAYPAFEPPEIKITPLGDQIGLYGAAGMVLLAEKAGRLEDIRSGV